MDGLPPKTYRHANRDLVLQAPDLTFAPSLTGVGTFATRCGGLRPLKFN